jgi:SAM-dependent methyltransferase
MMSNFEKYSTCYDLLYRDKDYGAEAAYVARRIRDWRPQACTVLELGSGTGRHGHLLAGMGFDVHGIERSPEMVAIAKAAGPAVSPGGGGSFSCEVGDICTARLGRSFDAIVALFHVVSYQTNNDALRQVFDVAAAHLVGGGVFLFDVWHGPAVLTQRPQRRAKRVEDGRRRVARTAIPVLDIDRGIVTVFYEVRCEDLASGEMLRFSERHPMRYLFPTEINLLSKGCGLSCVATEEFLTGQPPSPSTWGVAYILRK